MSFDIRHGDCREVMQTLHPESVDSIVSDPPYGLSFMGKGWDHGVPGEEFWTEALRVAKPGAHLLAFGGTRTYHRLACAIEDAGWEIRDCVMWVYGSGFPKSLDVSKAIDKANGETGRMLKFTAWMRTTGLKSSEIDRITGTNMGGHYLTAASQPAIPTAAFWAKLRPHCGEVPAWVDELVERIEAEREVVGTQRGTHNANGSGLGGTAVGIKQVGIDVPITAPATSEARQWSGWGTALKPAWEPVIVARKPLCGTVAENVLTHGTGGINVDGCRIEGIPPGVPQPRLRPDGNDSGHALGSGEGRNGAMSQAAGRWPANVIHDGSDEVVGLFPETGKSTGGRTVKRSGGGNVGSGKASESEWSNDDPGYGDTGSAARFFYCAKASKADRDEGCQGLEERTQASTYGDLGAVEGNPRKVSTGHIQRVRNHHPTVKPTALMRYLCRLVTPPGGVVLDPFTGSGSTGKAAVLEGFRFIGIEREAEYVEIARARIAAAVKAPALFE